MLRWPIRSFDNVLLFVVIYIIYRYIMAKHRKRYKRKREYLTTHLRKSTPIDNLERTARILVAVKNDGGGNRSEKSMEANSKHANGLAQ